MTWEPSSLRSRSSKPTAGSTGLWNNGEPVLQSLKNYPRATVEDFIEWLRQDFAEIAVVPYKS